ncbi:YEATS domain-containing protein 4 [Candida albicans P60002]|nr:YEATS domain-containing protein 4 [Candida albicans P60002]KHC55456.1 YEATS domain-containing protein 4 [Candida albicans P75010]
MSSTHSRRIKFVSISVPILYGNHAIKLTPEKRKPTTPPEHTHEWTVFFKPVLGDIDLTPLIKKVTFKLHETYENPVRTLESPPYQVTETGWGEFEIIIKLHFQPGVELGINEKNFQIFHALKLHPYNPQAPQAQQPQAQQSQAQPPQQQFGGEGGSVGTIIRERENGEVHSVLYDELVFNEPTEKTFEILTSKPVNLIPYKLSNLDKRDQEYIRPDEIDELNRMDIYIDKVKQEIENQRNQYKLLEQEKLALLQ